MERSFINSEIQFHFSHVKYLYLNDWRGGREGAFIRPQISGSLIMQKRTCLEEYL